MYWIVRLLILGGVIGIAAYYIRGPLVGIVLTSFVNLSLRKQFKSFFVGSFNLLPFAVQDFRATVHATRKSPEWSISWRSFKILFDFTKILDPLLSLLHVLPTTTDERLPKRGRMIRVIFHGFTASSPGLNYALFLDPPENKLPTADGSTTNADGDQVMPADKQDGAISQSLILKRLMQHIILFVDIVFEDFKFDFKFPSHGSHMIGSAEVMTISFPRPVDGVSETVCVMNQIDNGKMEILHDAQRAMNYVGRQAKMSVDVHLPSGVMEVLMQILGRDHDQMDVTLEPFLAFYRIYANAEDNSLEIRMARGLGSGGKMSMRLECECLDVQLRDARCPAPLRLTLRELEGELRTYFLTRSNERMYKDRKYLDPLGDVVPADMCGGVADDGHAASATGDSAKQTLFQYFMKNKATGPVIMSPNKDKVMKGGVRRVDFHSSRPDTVAYVEQVSGLKVKRVVNELDFIDHDRMDGFAQAVHFEKIHPELLDWLLVLQDTANKLPDSRFAHNKNSEMHFTGEKLLFSTHPVSSAYVPPPVAPQPPSSTVDTPNTAATAAPATSPDWDPPLDTLDDIPVEADQWVCFLFRNMVAKRELPYNEVDSLIDLRSDKFTIRTSLPQTALLQMYALDAVGDYDVDANSEDEDDDDDDDMSETTSLGDGQQVARDDDSSVTGSERGGFFDVNDGHAVGFTDSYALPLEAIAEGEERGDTTTLGGAEVSAPLSPKRRYDRSHAFTGTCWTFPAFAVRMKLGAKMNLEWVRADALRIEFLNAPHDILQSVLKLRSIDKHPFLASSTLSVAWCGPSMSCDMGAVQLKASVAGALKVLSGFGMMRKTGDRVGARMAYMKLRGALPPEMISHHVAAATVDSSSSQEPVEAPAVRMTVRMEEIAIDFPVDISVEDHEKRLQHELAREQTHILRERRLAEHLHKVIRRESFSSSRSDTHEATIPASLTVKMPDLRQAGVNRGDKSLRITLQGLEYMSSAGESTAEFVSGTVLLNSYPERPWVVMSAARYRKATVPLAMEDAFYQAVDVQTSLEAAYITHKAVTELSMEGCELFFSARMEFGLVADALLAQDAAYKLATRPRPRRRWQLQEGVDGADDGFYAYDADVVNVVDGYFSSAPLESLGAPHQNMASAVNSPLICRQASESTTQSFAHTISADSDGDAHMFGDKNEDEDDKVEEHEAEEEKIVPNPNTMHVQFKSFTVTYDAHYRGDYVDDFMTAELLGFDLYLDATKFPSAAQDEITALDLGSDGADEDLRRLQKLQQQGAQGSLGAKPSNGNLSEQSVLKPELLVYTGVFGGQLKFFTKYLIVKLKPFQEPLVKAEDMCFLGPMYNASVQDERVLMSEVAIALSDSVPCYADARSAASLSAEYLHEAQASGMRSTLPSAVVGVTEPLYVAQLRSSAPSKIYMDITMSGSSLELGMSHKTMDCIAALNAVTDTIVPPNKDPSPQLVPWDMWRFLLHGGFSFQFDSLSVKYHAMDYMTQKVKLNVKTERIKWYMDKGSFSLTTENFAVEAELNTTVLVGRRGQSKRGSGGQAVTTTRMCTIPALVLSLTHFRSDIREKLATLKQAHVDNPQSSVYSGVEATTRGDANSSGRVYSHHDVYLRPALVDPAQRSGNGLTPLEDYAYINNDRFHHFRSQSMSIRWEVELRLADDHDHDRDAPISFNLRLDHVVRILDALKPAAEEGQEQAGDKEEGERGGEGHPQQHREIHEQLSGCVDQAIEYNYGVLRPATYLGLGDLISVLKLQLVLNKIMISSWPSASNLGGFVMTIASSDLQLRMLRDIPQELLAPVKGASGTAPSVRTNISSHHSWEDWRAGGPEGAVFPLIIDHLYMDTAFVELYVRNWNMKAGSEPSYAPRQSFLYRNSLGGGIGLGGHTIQEPGNCDEVQSMFLPIFKTAHSTKMVISLTENGVVCAKDSVFTHSGILEKCSERALKTTVGDNRKARVVRHNPSVMAMSTNDGTGMFIIGKEWKALLSRAASGGNFLSSAARAAGLGPNRRVSALSMRMAEAKMRTAGEGVSQRRSSVAFADAPLSNRRASIARRGSVRARGRGRADSVASTGSDFSHNHSLQHMSSRASLIVPRNRRSSIRTFKPDRSAVRFVAWDPLVDGYRASLLSFKTNHSAFTPPPHALPASYGATQAGFVRGRHAQRSEEESSFGTKIWGLRITDLRLLFTIQIRDTLFNYVARGMDLFQPSTEADAERAGTRRRPTSVEARQEVQTTRDAAKATVYDFLQAKHDKQAAVNARARRAAAQEKGQFGFSPTRTLTPKQTTLDASTDPMLHFLSTYSDRAASPRSSQNFAQMMKLGGASSSPSARNKSKFQKGGRMLERKNNRPIAFTFQESQEISALAALEAEADSDADADAEETPPIASATTSRPFHSTAASAVGAGTVAPAGMRTHSPKSPRVAATAAPGPSSAPPVGAKHVKPAAKKADNERFFIVELIDPQVNFLDVNTHSSLIIVAGLSSLEGRRYSNATLPPSNSSIKTDANNRSSLLGAAPRGSFSPAQLVPQRQQEVRLRMDGVSAFTVPSNSPEAAAGGVDEEVDLVHWKHMENTECVDSGGELGYLGRRRGALASSAESPFMRVAIKDFQIRALYIFWTDVTVKEARSMYLIPSKEELVCTFKLELPVICVDILSWQFYVIMHVVRNVLLVPPPASASRANATQSEMEEAEKSKVLELMRDPVLLAKHDLRANMGAALDLKHKTSRDELKLLIEENLAGAMMNMELGSARFVEVFVGSCTWILRMNSTSQSATTPSPTTAVASSGARDWEKEQLKVEITGFHATFSYGEDRSASSLFEIQRFWAKDMDPGRDIFTMSKTGMNSSQHGKGQRGAGKENSKLDAVVMMPILSQTEHCARCGAAFLLEENHATACTFHADQDGEPGEYKDVTLTDELTGVQSVLKAWTCCGSHHAFAPGCSARPHTCKEVMIQIRAEANPAARVENIELSVLKSVDISIFPNSTYDLQVHVTKSLADVLHKYFSIDDIENYEITAQISDPPPEAAEDRKLTNSGWKRVRNVRRMLLPKKNKSGSGAGGAEGDDEASLFSGEDLSPSGPRTPPSEGGSGRYSASDLQSPPQQATPKSSAFSPWFGSSTPKRAVPQLESSTHSDSTESTSGTSGQRKSSIFGGLFGRKEKKKPEDLPPLSLLADTEPQPQPLSSGTSAEGGNTKRLKFNMMRARAKQNADRPERRSIAAPSSTHGTGSGGEQASDSRATTTAVANHRQEGVYVKFLRLGGIQLEVSTAGFMLNLTKFKAQMDEFRCQGEVLQWKTLVFNMERHLAVSLFTNAASNSLSRFTQLFRFTNQALDAAGMSLDPSIPRTLSAQWEGAGDSHLSTSLKRSALGLPPSQSTNSASNTEEDKAAALLGKKHVHGKGK